MMSDACRLVRLGAVAHRSTALTPSASIAKLSERIKLRLWGAANVIGQRVNRSSGDVASRRGRKRYS